MNYESVIEKALQIIDKLPSDSTFELKDLFEEDEWKEFGTHKAPLGKKFRKKVRNEQLLGLECVQEAQRKSCVYKKVC